jgi:hypothetical protein
MTKKSVRSWLFVGICLWGWPQISRAQETAAPATAQAEPATPQQQQALKLLEEVIADANTLRLPENRLRIQLNAGDLLWESDQTRARALFTEAAATLTGMMQSVSTNDAEYFRQIRTPSQLREELLRVVARHDPLLAYEMLQTTRPPEPPANVPLRGRPFGEAELEMSLLAQVASADPALALRRAEELLGKGQYPGTLVSMLKELRGKDEKAAASLSDKLLTKLGTETLLGNSEAGNLALTMLRPGPLPAESSTASTDKAQTKQALAAGQVLSDSDYRKLLNNVIAAALKATPRTANANAFVTGQPRQAGQTGQAPNAGRGGQRGGQNAAPAGPNQPQFGAGNAQNRRQGMPADPTQDNARRLLSSLSSMLTQVDKYAAGYGPTIRQKLAETGQTNNPRQALSDYNTVLRQGTADEVLQAASTAPPTTQPMLYQQAVMKALNENQPERARQIATQYLPEAQRAQMLQTIERRQQTNAAAITSIEQARQSLARLRSDEERIDLLTRLAASAAKLNNPKFASQLAAEARTLVNRRAESYEQLEAQLKVAHAYVELDPAQSIELLETGIERLNELLPAAALLEGFEVRLFKEGELPLANGGRLGMMVTRIGQELAQLAQKDFARAQAAADKFQRTEPRVATRLAVIQGVLGKPETGASATGFNPNQGFGPRGGGQPMRRP